ncbi:MAG: glycosyltransferase involved in cell wall biosynthesis [Planctomycetota bacterium]|jgi:glycosyltransferase involved in cell wall biosynthesis
MKLEVSIIIPVFNEEEAIPNLEEELSSVMQTLPENCEVVFVDDGSTDRSFELLSQIVKRRVWAKVVRLKTNFGQTQAMAAGIDESQGDILVCMDADLQNDPRDIPRLLDKMEMGYDIVSGWRADRKDKFLSRRLPSVCANRLIGALTGVRIHDYGCSLKAYDARIMKSLHLYSDMHRFLPAIAWKCGARVTEIKVNHRPRIYGTSKYGLSRVFKVFFDLFVIKMIVDFSSRPAHYFGLIGGMFFAGGLVVVPFLIWNMVADYRVNVVLPAVLILMLVTALYFFLMGTLGDLIVRVGNHDATENARSTVVEIA